MIRYRFTKVFGVNFELKTVEYLTNDSGDGIFGADGSQIAGNCQFSGGEKKLLRWLNSDSELTDARYFKSRSYAEKYAARKNLE